ncbi:hypothetical protein P170DRAFT_63216 [Aspergillus steynii IBT 23096]|uniref:DUF7702 domain-containing protein n=1 Tax=Aspergillus steynii IBT 23096 TaxID=1392250 RepID=A0A2I2FTC6_9EURO|nr:uncharacterized protein P170DRAFT_63216 [Aspergillus steynii IBT 23096]PLB43827.1 hypothetical protein P170DRAFT_63216 [Aspergillus steynii IBT 23096]
MDQTSSPENKAVSVQVMGLDYRHGISVLEAVVYIPTFIVALLVVFRHGFRKSAGWTTLVMFALVRVVGSFVHLATLAHPLSSDLYLTYAVCFAIGLFQLTVSCIGLLSRVCIHPTANPAPFPNPHGTRLGMSYTDSGKPAHPCLFGLLSLATIAAMILSIIGQVQSADAERPASANSLSQASVVIFLVVWAGLAILVFSMASRNRYIKAEERRLVRAVALSMPFLLVRVLYSFLGSFSHNPDFDLLTGSPAVLLGMAVLEEFVICVVCLEAGVMLA